MEGKHIHLQRQPKRRQSLDGYSSGKLNELDIRTNELSFPNSDKRSPNLRMTKKETDRYKVLLRGSVATCFSDFLKTATLVPEGPLVLLRRGVSFGQFAFTPIRVKPYLQGIRSCGNNGETLFCGHFEKKKEGGANWVDGFRSLFCNVDTISRSSYCSEGTHVK